MILILYRIHIYSLFRTTNEVRDIHRKQLEDLEIRLSNSKQNEQLIGEEFEDLKKEHNLLKNESEKVSLLFCKYMYIILLF